MKPATKKEIKSTRTSTSQLKNDDFASDPETKSDALSALIKICTAIGFMPMELTTSLQLLVDETKKLFDLYGCAIISFNEDMNPEVVFSGPHAMGDDLLKDFENRHKCLVVRDELPFIIQDTSRIDEGCRGFVFDKSVESHTCLPISTGKRLVGILVVTSLKKKAFTASHLELILSVATMAASVIQRAQLFRELKEAQQQIVQKEKWTVAGRLAAGVAHEVNNPIGIIINRIECIQSEAEEKDISDDLIKDLQIIGRYAHRISKIVGDLSIFSRTTYSESDFTRIDINDILADVFFLIAQKIKGKPIQFVKKLYPEHLFIMADPDRLAQVFINIIENAIHAIPDGGLITVSTNAGKKGIQAEISDSGAGISKENLNKIFDPFFTTKEVGKGTGLGLPISQAIIMDHHAVLDVDSTVSKGTTFTITFPKASEFNNESP
jgi:signal transduction histidine kinase